MSEVFALWATVAENSCPTHSDGGAVLNGSSLSDVAFSSGSSVSSIFAPTPETQVRNRCYPCRSPSPPHASCRSFAHTGYVRVGASKTTAHNGRCLSSPACCCPADIDGVVSPALGCVCGGRRGTTVGLFNPDHSPAHFSCVYPKYPRVKVV